MALDLVIANARIPGEKDLADIGIVGGKIATIAPAIVADAPREDACGRLVAGGLVECHIHLDKADILSRTSGSASLDDAVRETARIKADFTVEDVYARAAGVVEQAVLNGTTAMRTFVEIDPRAALRSFEAVKAVRRDCAHLIDIEICAFAQEGLTGEPETGRLLAAALAEGADVVGGCTYTDADPLEHIKRIFDLAQNFNVPADFHVDFDLVPTGSWLPVIVAETEKRGWQGRVACGHATKLAAWPAREVDTIGARLAAAGVGVVALPATDLFLLGRAAETLAPRGVAPLMRLGRAGATTAVATNNVLNAFTPYGDANLMRMANLFANVAHLSTDADLEAAFAMIGEKPARLMGRRHGIEVGAAADLVLLDAATPAEAVRRIAPALAGWKRGRKTFERPAPHLLSLAEPESRKRPAVA